MKINNQNSVNGAPLIWLRCEGVFAFILSILLYAHTGASWWRFAALLLVPDVSMLGYLSGSRLGAIGYNVVHSYVAPLLLTVLAITTAHTTAIPYLLTWVAHIAMDRALGYGLKYSSGFKHTHLGLLGKTAQP